MIFSENAFVINDLSNLDKVIKAVETLIKNNEYQDIIQKHLETKQLKNLAIELNQKAFDSNDITIPFPITTLDFGVVGGVRIDDIYAAKSLNGTNKSSQ